MNTEMNKEANLVPKDYRGFSKLVNKTPSWFIWAILILMLGGIISPFDLIPGDFLTGGVGLIDDAGYAIIEILALIMGIMKLYQNKQMSDTEGEIYDAEIHDDK